MRVPSERALREVRPRDTELSRTFRALASRPIDSSRPAARSPDAFARETPTPRRRWWPRVLAGAAVLGAGVALATMGLGGMQMSALDAGRQAAIETTMPAPAPSRLPLQTPASPANATLHGVAIAGAEFGKAPGYAGQDYVYPAPSEVDTFANLGMNTMRIPFMWERLQTKAFAPLDAFALSNLDMLVDRATADGAYVILDAHNYARYWGQVVGEQVPSTALADLWSRLAKHYAANPRVIFGLMNEPHDMSASDWLRVVNPTIAAIRAAGATNLVTVPGVNWSGAHTWVAVNDAMKGVVDPQHNYVFEMHQYFDYDSSGQNTMDCGPPTTGIERLTGATQWLATNHAHAILGEFAAGSSPQCLATLNNTLGYIDQHSAQWQGWVWWAAGPWWGNYGYSIEPQNGRAAPQTAVLEHHIPG